MARSIYEAEKLFKLANGEFTTDLSKLDIEPPYSPRWETATNRYYCESKKIEYSVVQEGGWRVIVTIASRVEVLYWIMLDGGAAWCMPLSGKIVGNGYFPCEDIGGVRQGTSSIYRVQ